MLSTSTVLAVSISALLAAAANASSVHLKWRELEHDAKHLYTYADFTTEFNKVASGDAQLRFEAKLKAIHAHNAQAFSWREGVNKFTDMTDAEFAMYKGKVFDGTSRAQSYMKYDTGVALKDLPPSIDWRTKGAVTPTKDQGGCGSCWAFSATESIESAVFMATGTLPVLSPQELVDCIPNPNSCGGTGGCSGSTEEYGFAWAMIYGMATDASYNYTARTGKTCLLGQGNREAVAGVSNFVKLPANDYESLMQAIATVGPISISVDASWGNYESGVYMGCSKNHTTIDHAVQLVGYGTESGQDYWLVRNSWSAKWGDGGYIKLPRDSTPSCDEDTSPGSGNGCKTGAKEQQVCGACGMLSDSSYPLGGYLVQKNEPIPAPGEYPLPAYGTKLCGCQGDGECAALGQHCCCYSAAKDDISCTQDPVTQPNQCCGDPSNDCKKSAKLDAAGAQRPQPPWSL